MATVIASYEPAITEKKGVIASGETAGVTVSGSPSARIVDVYEFGDAPAHVRRVKSKQDGSFEVPSLRVGVEHIVIGVESRRNQQFNDVIRAGVFPSEP
jgi:hypothetical protein